MSLGVKILKNSIPKIINKKEELIQTDKEKESENNDFKMDYDYSTKDKIYNYDSIDKKEEIIDEFDWYLEIPKIELYAPIEDGTDDEILNKAVGHFEDTSRRNGNCGLAAHNRGYRVNYFSRLKELDKGDLIYYFVDDKKYKYRVADIIVIYETDWSMLEDTEDDRITLITCIENRDEYRLCVQGVLDN